jgi:hypothetical protein
MKLLYAILAILVITSFQSRAQSLYEIKQAIDFFNSNKMQRGEAGLKAGLENVEGSPYLNDDFIKGSVFTKSKTEFVGIPLRFNVFNDEIEFKTDDGAVMALAGPETIEKIEFGDFKIVYLPYREANRIKKGFFIVIEEGKASLFARPMVSFQEAKAPGAYQNAEPAKFIRGSDEYYIMMERQPAQLIQKKQDMTDAFAGHIKELESFIKENKIRPNKPENLRELVKYYNSF